MLITDLIQNSIIIFLMFFSLSFAIIIFLSKNRQFSIMLPKSIFIGYIATVAYITLLHRRDDLPSFINYAIETDLLASFRRAAGTSNPYLAFIELRNIVLNIILFMPFGILLPAIFPKIYKFIYITTFGFLISLTIETLQLVFNRGVFSLEDIMYNTLGAILGYAIFASIKISFPKSSA